MPTWLRGTLGAIGSVLGSTLPGIVLRAVSRGFFGLRSLTIRPSRVPLMLDFGAVPLGIGALAATASRADAEFTRLGRSITDLSASTGLGSRQSGDIIDRFGAFGIKSE